MVHYIFPSVKSNLELERRCPHCHRLGGNKHSRICYRAASDIKVHVIAQQRMKCPYCSTTWTIRVQGISHERQQLLCVEPIKETDTQRVRRHVRRVMAMFGAEQLRADELSVYEHIVAEPVQKVCIAHWLKSKCKRAWDLARQFRAEGCFMRPRRC